MKKISISLLVLMVSAIVLAAELSGAPQMINYQGRLIKPSGAAFPDTNLTVTMRIFDAPSGGNQLWQEQVTITLRDGGYFHAILGQVNPITPSVFGGATRYLGVQPQSQPEFFPRTLLVAVPYSFSSTTTEHADVADRALLSRDLYHEIVDLSANDSMKIPFLTRNNTQQVTIYLYGDKFDAPLLAHSHSGVEPHSHNASLSTSPVSIDHSHSFGGTTTAGGADHTHTGATSAVDLAHSHSGSVGSTDLSHIHSIIVDVAGSHQHEFKFVGVGSTGPYLVRSGDLLGLSTSPNTPAGTARLSVQPDGIHSHSASSGGALGAHGHTISLSTSLGSHLHSFSTGIGSNSHTHSLNGTTSLWQSSHSHTVEGTTNISGAGTSTTGTTGGNLPTSIRVYVDGVEVAGPFSGMFDSGAIDLSASIGTAGVHWIVIRDEGGTGGRVTYNLFVE
jgi:hypothetical protein